MVSIVCLTVSRHQIMVGQPLYVLSNSEMLTGFLGYQSSMAKLISKISKELRTFLQTLLLCLVTSLGWDKGIFGICTFHIIPFDIALHWKIFHPQSCVHRWSTEIFLSVHLLLGLSMLETGLYLYPSGNNRGQSRKQLAGD